MLCRNAGLAKSAIGAIRVQYQETFVEIASDAVAAMKQELGEGLAMEQGATLTELAGPPDFDASPKGPPADPRPSQRPHGRPRMHADVGSKRRKSPEEEEKITKAAPGRAKPKTKPPEKAAHSNRGKDKRPKDAAPKKQSDGTEPKAKASRKPARQQNRDRDALNKSKALRSGKARHASKAKAQDGESSRSKQGKGGDARPFRESSKKT